MAVLPRDPGRVSAGSYERGSPRFQPTPSSYPAFASTTNQPILTSKASRNHRHTVSNTETPPIFRPTAGLTRNLFSAKTCRSVAIRGSPRDSLEFPDRPICLLRHYVCPDEQPDGPSSTASLCTATSKWTVSTLSASDQHRISPAALNSPAEETDNLTPQRLSKMVPQKEKKITPRFTTQKLKKKLQMFSSVATIT